MDITNAACLGHPNPDLWFPVSSDPRAAAGAITICKRCPIKDDCLEEHLAEPFGIWGATTEDDRATLRRRQRRARATL